MKTAAEKKQRRLKALGIIAIVLASLILLYLFLVYTSFPFIAKWRTIYIETAMSTMTHQWLATAFIPGSVIDDVMEDVDRQFLDNKVESSDISGSSPTASPGGEGLTGEEYALWQFSSLFPEIDMDTLPSGISYKDLPDLQIKDIAGWGMMTTAGDTVWAVDVPNKLLIVEVAGEGYAGKLAIIKDSAQVSLAVNSLADRGQTVTEICDTNGAVLGVNASGFQDYEGVGDGRMPIGLMISDGEPLHDETSESYYQIAGYDEDDNFRVGFGLDTEQLRDAMQFYPIIVLNGENRTEGTYGMGIQPRTVIGQTRDKTTLMLVIDGRQVHSLGATISECAVIMLRYGCWNAMNMDGGSSSSMTYMGEMITKTSSPAPLGRTLPNAWVVRGN